MKSRPILFSALMIKALLREQDAKSQTRRIIKPVRPRADGRWPAGRDPVPDCKYGRVGDRLWVREKARVLDIRGRPDRRDIRVRYEADGAESGWLPYPARLTGKPVVGKCLAYGCHREASRIALELTSVRVERVQDISEGNARAEGVVLGEPVPVNIIVKQRGKKTERSKGVVHDFTYRGAFCRLWGAINGAESWKSNCFVWVLSFRRVAQAQEVATNG